MTTPMGHHVVRAHHHISLLYLCAEKSVEKGQRPMGDGNKRGKEGNRRNNTKRIKDAIEAIASGLASASVSRLLLFHPKPNASTPLDPSSGDRLSLCSASPRTGQIASGQRLSPGPYRLHLQITISAFFSIDFLSA
jgi:hypothetical protein